jgi:hypothetical protein
MEWGILVFGHKNSLFGNELLINIISRAFPGMGAPLETALNVVKRYKAAFALNVRIRRKQLNFPAALGTDLCR